MGDNPHTQKKNQLYQFGLVSHFDACRFLSKCKKNCFLFKNLAMVENEKWMFLYVGCKRL